MTERITKNPIDIEPAHKLHAEQFDSMEHQQETASIGMWIFLATEVLFFGGLLLVYTVYRTTYPTVFELAGKNFNLGIGTINTVILLTSSYFIALAVHFARNDQSRRSARFLALTWVLGFSFLCLKAYEYYDDIERNIVPGSSYHDIGYHYVGPNPEAARMLYFIYYALTGLHALHMTIGLGAIAVLYHRSIKKAFSSHYYTPVEVVGLYWHFVDIVWLFLYPLLYLMDRHS